MRLATSNHNGTTSSLLSIVVSLVWLGGIVVGMTQTPTDDPISATLPGVAVIGKRDVLGDDAEPKSVLAVSQSADPTPWLTTH